MNSDLTAGSNSRHELMKQVYVVIWKWNQK